MRRTLFLIPHDVFGIPVWGFGWALFGVILAAIAYCVSAHWRGQRVTDEIKTNGFAWMIAATIVAFVLPQIELQGFGVSADGTPIRVGTAIRGYGVMMLLGVVLAVGLAVFRAKRRQIDTETILGLAPWMLVFGIIGARLFYVIEYRDFFWAQNSAGQTDWGTTFRQMFDFTSGGLVVYGSIIGGLIGTLVYCYRQQVNVLRIGDVVIPCLFLGICLGRLGCLLNGCCYGSRCDEGGWALHFPPGSPVYQEQLLSGELVGLSRPVFVRGRATAKRQENEFPFDVARVAEHSLAAHRGIKPGQQVSGIYSVVPPKNESDSNRPIEDTRKYGLRLIADGQTHTWMAKELPDRALPVWPAQLISSITALALCLFLLGISPYAKRDGVLLAIGFAAYAILRFCLEWIRNDEPTQLGTGLTISQLVSIITLILSVGLLVYSYSQPTKPISLETRPPA